LTVNGNTIFRTAFGELRNLVILFLIVKVPNGHISEKIEEVHSKGVKAYRERIPEKYCRWQ
jgi:hypothetical protein